MKLPAEVHAMTRQTPKRHTKGKWYAVPDYSPSGNKSSGGKILDSAGQHVAFFEWIEDAAAVVKMMNGEQQ